MAGQELTTDALAGLIACLTMDRITIDPAVGGLHLTATEARRVAAILQETADWMEDCR